MKYVIIILGILITSPSLAQAHQSGCHRWHSCPSDTGSYVCGDLGYTSGCPKVNESVKEEVKPKPVQPKPVTPPVPEKKPIVTPPIQKATSSTVTSTVKKNIPPAVNQVEKKSSATTSVQQATSTVVATSTVKNNAPTFVNSIENKPIPKKGFFKKIFSFFGVK